MSCYLNHVWIAICSILSSSNSKICTCLVVRKILDSWLSGLRVSRVKQIWSYHSMSFHYHTWIAIHLFVYLLCSFTDWMVLSQKWGEVIYHLCTQNIHEKKEQQPKVKRYKCLKCPREYRSKNHLERHTLSHLTPKKPRMYTCSLCNTKFTTRGHRYVQGQ